MDGDNLPLKRLLRLTTKIIINTKTFKGMNYHDRTELLNRYIPRHSQHVAWGSTTRSIEGQTLPHENNKTLGLPCLLRETQSTGRSAYWADTSALLRQSSFVLCAFGRSVCSFRSAHQMMTYNSILPLI